MARRKYKYTQPIKKEKSSPGWFSFFVMTKQGSYKMTFQGRKEARKERINMEKLLKIRMK